MVFLFDVNETLLDLSVLDAPLAALAGEAEARTRWFQHLLQAALSTTLVGPYVDFGTLARQTLHAEMTRAGRTLHEADWAAVRDRIATLPPHSDVPEGLGLLHDAGHRLAALSNGTPALLNAQLQHADLADRFDQILSADAVQRLKPAPEPYLHACDVLAVAPPEVCFVASHTWDLLGAQAVGCETALLTRPGTVAHPAYPSPTYTAPNLRALATSFVVS